MKKQNQCKVIKYGNMTIWHDGVQWVTQKETMGIGNDGKEKMIKNNQKNYFSHLKHLALHINNQMLMKKWDEGLITALDFLEENQVKDEDSSEIN